MEIFIKLIASHTHSVRAGARKLTALQAAKEATNGQRRFSLAVELFAPGRMQFYSAIYCIALDPFAVGGSLRAKPRAAKRW